MAGAVEFHSEASSSGKERRSAWSARPAAGCLVSLVLALACLCPTLGMLHLTRRGDIAYRRGGPGEIRLWLVQSADGTALALSTTRRAASALGPTCSQTAVRFLPLAGGPQAEPAAYCTCTLTTGKQVQRQGACPP
jgi:hypothetical protein